MKSKILLILMLCVAGVQAEAPGSDIDILILGQSNGDSLSVYKDSLVAVVERATGQTVNVYESAVGGTPLIGTVNSWNLRGAGTLFQNAVTGAKLINPDYVIWWQGEGDATVASERTTKQYCDTLTKLINEFRDSVNSCPWLIVQVRAGYTAPSDWWFWQIKQAHERMPSLLNNVHLAATAEGYPGGVSTDFIHLLPQSHYKIGKQVGSYINYLEGDASAPVPLLKQSVAINATRDTITVTTNKDIQGGVQFKGFTFWNGGDTVIPASVTRTASSTIKAAFSTALRRNIRVAWGFYQIPNTDSAVVPHDTTEYLYNLRPFLYNETDGILGKIDLLYAPELWGKGDGSNPLLTGMIPIYSKNGVDSARLFNFTSGYGGYVDTAGNWVQRGTPWENATCTTTYKLKTNPLRTNTFVCKFRWRPYHTQAQALWGVGNDASNYARLYIGVSGGYVLEFRYTVGGTYNQVRSLADTNLLQTGREYLWVGRQRSDGLMTMYLKDLTDNTVKSLTYEYQNYMTSSVSYSYGLRIGSGNLGTSGNNNYHYSDIHYFGVIPDYVTNEELITLQASIESYKGIAENNQLDLQALAITAQPQNDTVLSGQQGVFTVGYTGDSVRVAWYKNGTFTGVYGDTLRVTGNNGDSVQAVLWNDEDTVSSSMAYLTVYTVKVDSTEFGNGFSLLNKAGVMYPTSGWTVRVVKSAGDTLNATTGVQDEHGIRNILPSEDLPTKKTRNPYVFIFSQNDLFVYYKLYLVGQLTSGSGTIGVHTGVGF